MTRLTDKPMARAANHLAAGRYPQAIGAYRAVIGIDANEYQAHVGIAEAEAARGNLSDGVDALLGAASAYAGEENHVAALALFGHALGMDPLRMEVHLDVAICESAAGHHEAAIERCEALALMYVRAGRTDEAEEIFRFVANWEPGEPSIHSAPISVGVSTTGPIALSSLARAQHGSAPRVVSTPMGHASAPQPMQQPAMQQPAPQQPAPQQPAPQQPAPAAWGSPSPQPIDDPFAVQRAAPPAPQPFAPQPFAPQPPAPQQYEPPQPFAPQPPAPQQYEPPAPQPFAPQPLAPQPPAPQPFEPPQQYEPQQLEPQPPAQAPAAAPYPEPAQPPAPSQPYPAATPVEDVEEDWDTYDQSQSPAPFVGPPPGSIPAAPPPAAMQRSPVPSYVPSPGDDPDFAMHAPPAVEEAFDDGPTDPRQRQDASNPPATTPSADDLGPMLAAKPPPAAADPWEQWLGDPRADAGGTAVFRVPDGFYEQIDKTMVAPIPAGLFPGSARSPEPPARPLAAPIIGGSAAAPPTPPPPRAAAPTPAPPRSAPAAPPPAAPRTTGGVPAYTPVSNTENAAAAPVAATPSPSPLIGRPTAPPPTKPGSAPQRTGSFARLGAPTPPPMTTPRTLRSGASSTRADAPKSATTRFTAVPNPIKQAAVVRSGPNPALATPRASRVRTATTKHAPLPTARPSAAPLKTGGSPALKKTSTSLVDRLRRRAGLDENAKPAPKPTKSPARSSAAGDGSDDQTIRRPNKGPKKKAASAELDIPSPPLDTMATAIHKGSPVKRGDVAEEVTVRRLATDGSPLPDDEATQIFQTNDSEEAAGS